MQNFVKKNDHYPDRPLVFMFPGLGTQYYHMAEELYKQHAAFRVQMNQLDQAAFKYTKTSTLCCLYNTKGKKGDFYIDIQLSSFALFFVEYALARILIQDGLRPSAVVGASLGEFAAAAIAGIINQDEAMELIAEKSAQIKKSLKSGGMLAILANVELFQKNPELCENSELAAINFSEHFVVSGSLLGLEKVKAFLLEKQIVFQQLGVAAAFHSSLMDHVAFGYKAFLKNYSFKRPQIRYFSSATGRIIDVLPQNHFWNVIRKPILFHETIENMEKDGQYAYLDLGPSGTLSTFVKYILSKKSASKAYILMSPFGQDMENYNKIKSSMTNKRKTRDKKMQTFLFPGQGSQAKGMGGKLFEEFKELIRKADEILGYSIRDLCINDPQSQLGKTQYTQVAVYIINALAYLKRIEIEKLPKPDFTAGHSLGEYNALLAAEVFDFETGLQLVKKRGELMARAKNGAMAAVIKLNERTVEQIINENGFTSLRIANYNTPSQFVIAGPKDDIDKVAPMFTAAKAIFIPLNVSGAFHTTYMSSAKEKFSEFIEPFKLSFPQVPVISNVTAQPYHPEEIKTNLIEQITSPVRWTESIRYLMKQKPMTFSEIGHGSVLTGLVRNIEKESQPLKISQFTDKMVPEKKNEDSHQIALVLNEPPKGCVNDGWPQITAESLGCSQFRKDYNLKYAYVTGGMYRGIASKELVQNVCKAGLLGYFGTGGLDLEAIEDAICYLSRSLDSSRPYGMNLMAGSLENQIVDLFLRYNVRHVEAAAYMQITPALVRYRLKGVQRYVNSGVVLSQNHIMAKVSRPEIAELFLSPPPERIVEKLLAEGSLTDKEALNFSHIPMADDVCVEADSAGHTDQGVAYALMPSMLRLRDKFMEKYMYPKKIRIGAAGGIGAPEAAASAFVLGADFILTGSINQCTVEAGTSDVVKDLLEQMNVQDTDYAPAGDMFEFGAKVQVLRKGLFFPARANKLYGLYMQYNSLDEIDEKTKKQLVEKYFKRSFEDIYADVISFFQKNDPGQIERAENNPKHKMALIFRWYFNHTTNLALSGSADQKVDYQIHCGPALGAFNQWVKGTALESWRNRKVAEIGIKMMVEAAELLNKRFRCMAAPNRKVAHENRGD